MGRKQKHKRSPHVLPTRQTAAQRTHPIPLALSPEQFLKNGDIPKAIDALQTLLKSEPTDERKRLLAECFGDLQRYQEAVDVWCTIVEKTPADLFSLGVSFLILKEWDQAVHFLETVLQYGESPSVYYLLACACMQGGSSYSLQTEVAQRVYDLLQCARRLPECPGEAYLLLSKLIWPLALNRMKNGETESDEQSYKQAVKQANEEEGEILEEAFNLYPDQDEIRLEFGKNLISRKQYETALMVLVPLANRTEPEEEVIAWALDAAIGAGLFEKAHHYLNMLPVESDAEALRPSREVGLAKFRGDLYLRQGNFKAALECYAQERQNAAFVAQFLGTFSCSLAWLRQEQKAQAVDLAKQGAVLWFEHDDLLDRSSALDTVPIMIGGIYIGNDNPALCVKEVCEQLLAEDGALDSALKGQLSYLLYAYHANYYDGRGDVVWEQKAEHQQLLLQAARLFPHPFMSAELSDLFLEMGEVSQAVTHHLSFCLQFFAQESEDFFDTYASLTYVNAKIETVAERREIHATAWKILQTCQTAGIIQAVFVPFFTSFWRFVLQDGEMFQEMVDVTALLMKTAEEINPGLWFSHAWGLDSLDRNDEAESAYRQLLEHSPDHAVAFYNLSVSV